LIYRAAMRIWLAVAVVVVGCKKNAEQAGPSPGSGSQAVAAVAADAAVTVAPPDAAAPAGPAPIDEDTLLDVEAIGPLKLRMPEADVIELLGKPAQRSKVIEEGATGLFVSTWTWDGVAMHMAAEAKKGPFKVATISVGKPPHATARGIKVGSTLAELEKTYPRSTEEGNNDPSLYLVGSVYGGLLFRLKDGAVTEIFLGAMAF
jgi:hypothetical protein